MRKWLFLAVLLAGCAKPPRLSVTVQVTKTSPTTGRMTLTVQNEEDRPTTPILVEASVQPPNGAPIRVAHPSAFVLNRREAREIVAPFVSDAPSLNAIVVLHESESGKVLPAASFKILPATLPPQVPAKAGPATPRPPHK